jgi:hypothetical protein
VRFRRRSSRHWTLIETYCGGRNIDPDSLTRGGGHYIHAEKLRHAEAAALLMWPSYAVSTLRDSGSGRRGWAQSVRQSDAL